MYLAERLRQIRQFKKLSQGDIQNRSGLLRCYISRVENGHTVPALETLEKIARALGVPLYQLFYEDGSKVNTPTTTKNVKEDWASWGKGLRLFTKIRRALSSMNQRDRALLLHVATKMSKSAARNEKAL